MIHYVNEKGNVVARVYESSHGGFVFQIGMMVETTENPFGIGYIKGGFNAYISTRCDSMAEVRRTLKHHLKNSDTVYTFHLQNLKEVKVED